MPTVRLKPGRERSVLRRHPWVFSGSIADVSGDPQIGETVDVLDSKGGFLAQGAFSPHSQIRVRIWSWKREEIIGPDFLSRRINKSLDARKRLIESNKTNAYRLVHAESDLLPGLIVDRYDNTLVVQCLSAGVERWREEVVDILAELADIDCVYERSDIEVRKLEGLDSRSGTLYGSISSKIVEIFEYERRYLVNISEGHKTGFYIDQRKNRQRVVSLARSKRVLDCFSYTGGFTISALAGGAASVYSVETSSDALSLARDNMKLNGLNENKIEWMEENVFEVLRSLRDRAKQFDLIILDPPKFAPTVSHASKAARGYKDINLLALKLLHPGGYLVTFSCSGGIGKELFQKIVAGAALDAGVDTRIIEYLHQGVDHPVALNFPEGEYLKGLIIRKS